jgi:hypothetical protein
MTATLKFEFLADRLDAVPFLEVTFWQRRSEGHDRRRRKGTKSVDSTMRMPSARTGSKKAARFRRGITV